MNFVDPSNQWNHHESSMETASLPFLDVQNQGKYCGKLFMPERLGGVLGSLVQLWVCGLTIWDCQRTLDDIGHFPAWIRNFSSPSWTLSGWRITAAIIAAIHHPGNSPSTSGTSAARMRRRPKSSRHSEGEQDWFRAFSWWMKVFCIYKLSQGFQWFNVHWI